MIKILCDILIQLTLILIHLLKQICQFCMGLSILYTLDKVTSYKYANCNDKTLFPLLGHIQSGKLKS